MKRTEAIKEHLNKYAKPWLAKLYNENMEVQVNVFQGDGQRLDKEFRGKDYQVWTNGEYNWKSFRIPYKAKTDPEYTDIEQRWPISKHAEAIGITGWDFRERGSKHFFFDFDSITGHQEGLTKEQFKELLTKAKKLDYLTIYTSKGGMGVHIRIDLTEHFPTKTHTEHAAVARALLGKMSADIGYDFISTVDCCGQVAWIWHKDMHTDFAFQIIKESPPVSPDIISKSWKEHIKVVSGQNSRTLPQNIEREGQTSEFEKLVNKKQMIPLDDEHLKLINYLKTTEAEWVWDQDNHLLRTHTVALERAHKDLKLKGFFKTKSPGTDLSTPNCFLFPMKKGAWAVRRYGMGIQEHESWEQDREGWTRCYFNRSPTLEIASRIFGGIKDEKDEFIFSTLSAALKAINIYGVDFNLDDKFLTRKTSIKFHKDGDLLVKINAEEGDKEEDIKGWLRKGKVKGYWQKFFKVLDSPVQELELTNFDEVLRHLVTPANDDSGWVLKNGKNWGFEPIGNIDRVIMSMGYSAIMAKQITGSSVLESWKLVSKPFQPEYTGNREWNRNSAQLKYTPLESNKSLHYPHWTKLLNHCGRGLDMSIRQDDWCRENGILTGADYLKCWIASLFQQPTSPLPFLFFHSQQQNTGKSMFHEALSLLFKNGYQFAVNALTNKQGFNGELAGAVLCVVEEVDLNGNKTAYNRIKEWVTAKELPIHPKTKTPYHVQNTTHWIQCANDHKYCPIFPGDTRITMIRVDPLDKMIPKYKLTEDLKKEAQHFITEIFRVKLPPIIDRLNLPVINTEDKKAVQVGNMTALEAFIYQECEYVPGHVLVYSEFYSKFSSWLDGSERIMWTKKRVGQEMPPHFPKGRCTRNAKLCFGNIAFKETAAIPGKRLILANDYLKEVEDETVV